VTRRSDDLARRLTLRKLTTDEQALEAIDESIREQFIEGSIVGRLACR